MQFLYSISNNAVSVFTNNAVSVFDFNMDDSTIPYIHNIVLFRPENFEDCHGYELFYAVNARIFCSANKLWFLFYDEPAPG